MNNSAPDARPYRRGVGAVIFNAEGLVFAGERRDTIGAWQFPQGGLDHPDEDTWLAVLRELREEIGTDRVEKLAETENWLRYDFPSHFGAHPVYKNNRGQEQKWFALRFTGQDSDIILDLHHEPEFGRWQWMKLQDIPSLIVPFKRALYDQLVQEFIGFSAS